MIHRLDYLARKVGAQVSSDVPAAIHQGDCIEALASLPCDSVDLVITSPPYNIGMPYERVKPVADYVSWCETWLRELARVVTPTGAVWLNLGFCEVPGVGDAVPISYLLWDKMPMYLVQEVVWHYRAGSASKKRLSPRNEKCLWFVADPTDYHFDLDAIRSKDVRYPNQKRHGKLRCNPLGKNPTDVWDIPRVTGGKGRRSAERTDHPAQMPVELARRIVRACSKPGEVVLDPFSGSGTTAVAAVEEGRAAIGFERDHRYVEISQHRLQNTIERPQPDPE